MTRRVALVAVGVNRTRPLVELRGAAAGARLLAEWFEAQRQFGVHVTIEVLVDEQADGSSRPVRVSDVQDVVGRLTDSGFDMLTIYLAGHGIVKSGTDEQVLLSNAGRHPQEAVNVVATAQAARFCGLPHVVIISDACRNAIDPFSPLGMVAGAPVISRKGIVGIKPTQVDVFYATEPSQTAKEYYGEGFFTKILCRILTAPPGEICEARQEYAPNRVIDGYMLGEYLRDAVPREAVSLVPAFNQTPDAIVLSRPPAFLGYAPPLVVPAPPAPPAPRPDSRADGASPAPPPPPPDPPMFSRKFSLLSQWSALKKFFESPKKWDAKRANYEYFAGESVGARHVSAVERLIKGLDDPGLADLILSYSGNDKHESLSYVVARLAFPDASVQPYFADTDLFQAGLTERVGAYLQRVFERPRRQPNRLLQLGITVHGAVVTRVFVPDRIRHSNMRTPSTVGGAAMTVMVELDGRTITPLPVLPHHSVVVCVADSIVRDIVLENRQHQSAVDDKDRSNLIQRRAVMASLAASGKLHLVGGISAPRLRAAVMYDGAPDPTLVLYAAYGCALAGNDAGLQRLIGKRAMLSRAKYGRDGGAVFDLALLAGVRPAALAWFAPCCPMLSLGWSILSGTIAATELHPFLAMAGPLRLNSDWTTFRSADCEPLLEALDFKEPPWK